MGDDTILRLLEFSLNVVHCALVVSDRDVTWRLLSVLTLDLPVVAADMNRDHLHAVCHEFETRWSELAEGDAQLGKVSPHLGASLSEGILPPYQ
jgi:hypothetical protein